MSSLGSDCQAFTAPLRSKQDEISKPSPEPFAKNQGARTHTPVFRGENHLQLARFLMFHPDMSEHIHCRGPAEDFCLSVLGKRFLRPGVS